MSRTGAARPRVVLGIADELGVSLEGADFIGCFVGLGSLLRRRHSEFAGRQLVLAISVPRRDYVASLIGAGWMLTSPPPSLDEAMTVFRGADSSTYLRAVTDKKVVVGRFAQLDESFTPPRVITGGVSRSADWYKAVDVLEGPCDNAEGDVPESGYLAKASGASGTWLQRIAAPPLDLALIGTAKWLLEDLGAWIGRLGDTTCPPVPLANYVLPRTDRSVTWATAVIPAARLGEGEGLPSQCRVAILDRFGAIKYLNEITTPVVICVIDRSVVDDSAAELLVQTRMSNSRPIMMKDDLGWEPPPGVEAFAFTVAI